MYVANVQLKLMQSFVNSPQVHIIALKNPAMFSGPLALLQDVLAEALRLAGFSWVVHASTPRAGRSSGRTAGSVWATNGPGEHYLYGV